MRTRYDRRNVLPAARYSMLNPAVYMTAQEKERALIRWIRTCGITPVAEKHVLEIGCGYGDNLLQLLRLGFSPERLVANELLEERAQSARRRLPGSIPVLVGDASELPMPPASFDVVLQSLVFSSILDAAFQQRLASRLWSLVRAGGGILWYDFTRNNPRNRDVRGISIRTIQRLFPDGLLYRRRLTLAPPISRLVTRVHPEFYRWFAAVPWLRTHVLCWISKES
jgi:SAM-dependent methyltransferase